MMKNRIESYQLEWHPSKGARYRVKLEHHQNWTHWHQVNAADFMAISLILKEEASYYDEKEQALFSHKHWLNQDKSFSLFKEEEDDIPGIASRSGQAGIKELNI
jgi:hypothetical protein